MKINGALLAALLFSKKLVYTSRCWQILSYNVSGFEYCKKGMLPEYKATDGEL